MPKTYDSAAADRLFAQVSSNHEALSDAVARFTESFEGAFSLMGVSAAQASEASVSLGVAIRSAAAAGESTVALRTVTCPACKMAYRLGEDDSLDLPTDCDNCANIAADVIARREGEYDRLMIRARRIAGQTIELDNTLDIAETRRAISRRLAETFNDHRRLLTGPVTVRHSIAGDDYAFTVTPIYNGTDRIPSSVQVTNHRVVAEYEVNTTTRDVSGELIPETSHGIDYERIDADIDNAWAVHLLNVPPTPNPTRQKPKPKRDEPEVVQPDIRKRRIVFEDE